MQGCRDWWGMEGQFAGQLLDPARCMPAPTAAAVPLLISMQMLAFGAGVLLPATDSFVWLMAGSCGVVALAAALCTAFALRTSCGAGLGSPLPEAQEEWSEA
jgi:hypothetical protein